MPREKSPPTEPLPTSAATTSIFNALSMRHSQRQQTLLSKMGSFTRTASSQPSRSRHHQQQQDDEEDDDDLNFYDASLGVGVKDAKKKAREQSQAHDELRKKMFGKRRKEEEDRKKREGSSEEEEGRGAVGRRKKVKKRAREDDEDGDEAGNKAVGEEMARGEVVVDGAGHDVERIQGVSSEGPSKKKKKNKNKKKRHDAVQ